MDVRIVDSVCEAITRFVARNLQSQPGTRRPPRGKTAEFQIIVIFHQRHTAVANSLTTAFTVIGNSRKWIELSSKFARNYRISNIWLLSCESAVEEAASKPELRAYFFQAIAMLRAASIGFMTPVMDVSASGLLWYYPSVYTFSTGNTILGSVTVHPNHIWFFEVEDYAVRDMRIVRTGGSRHSLKKPVAGRIYRHVEGQRARVCVVPKGKEVDLVRHPPIF